MENSYRYFKNNECQYYPCHKALDDFNCLFCYCPLYNRTNCPGNPSYVERAEKKIRVCAECTFPHEPENYDVIIELLKKEI